MITLILVIDKHEKAVFNDPPYVAPDHMHDARHWLSTPLRALALLVQVFRALKTTFGDTNVMFILSS